MKDGLWQDGRENRMGHEGGGTEARKNRQVTNNDQGKRKGHSGASCPGPETMYTKDTDAQTIALPCESWSQVGPVGPSPSVWV